MIHATKPELEAIIRDAADALIAKQALAWEIYDAAIQLQAAMIREAAAANETEWRLCWWSSLAGCGLTLAGLWLGGAL